MKSIFSIICFVLLIGCNQAQDQSKERSGKQFKNGKSMNANFETATLGGGCYWCIEVLFQRLQGVEKVESGFSGGKVKDPTYYEVTSGKTGHAEVIHITFDPSKVPFSEILKVFFTMHDPTTLNRQGNDVGTQYRSAVFYHNDAQKKATEEIIAELNKAHAYPSPIVTEVVPFEKFYKADEEHQNYYNENKSQPYCAYVIQPKIEKFEKVFKDRLKK